jgi:hypothetical protein
MSFIVDIRNKKTIILLVILAVVTAVLIISFVYPVLSGTPGARQTGVIPGVTPDVTRVAITGKSTGIPSLAPTTPAINPARTAGALETPVPLPSTASVTTRIPTPGPYSVSISPMSASAKPGETLAYTLVIEGGEGMTEPIHLSLTATALFFSQTYDLGDLEPPFPKTLTTGFTVPGNIPPGITINGVLKATGGGQTHSREITLMII